MRNWFLALLLLSWASDTHAVDHQISAELTSPSTKWVNQEQCKDPDKAFSISFQVTFSGFEQVAGLWAGNPFADFYISNSVECSSKVFEIGTERDVQLSVNNTQILFPDDFLPEGKYSFADLQAEEENATLDCESIEGEYYFCIEWKDTVVSGPDAQEVDHRFFGSARLVLDFVPPGIPTGIDVSPGASNLLVSWNIPVSSNLDIVFFVAYCALSSDLTTIVNECSAKAGDSNSCTIKELTNDVAYTVWVVSEDRAKNRSDKSVEATGVPFPNQIKAEISSPTNQRVNREQCVDPNIALSTSLNVTFSGFEQVVGYWDGNPIADIYISDNQECTSKVFEIGDELDFELHVFATQVRFPEDFMSIDNYTLADLITELENEALKCESIDGDYYFCIEWVDTVPAGPDGKNVKRRFFGSAQMIIDFVPPGTPTEIVVSPGESSLTVKWTKPSSNHEDIVRYRSFCALSTDLSTTVKECSVKGEDARSCTITGLTNGVEYTVWVISEDEVENRSDRSATGTGVPIPLDDFFEYYKNQGGVEQGGFCFVATAAYGSYNNQMVMHLRQFRDQVLTKSPAGKALIDAYYRIGPRWARAIRGSELLTSVARWSLTPVVYLFSIYQAGIVEWILFVFAALLLAMGVNRFRRLLAGIIQKSQAVVLVLIILFGFSASADEIRAEVSSPIALPDYQLQLRFGHYYPNIDTEMDKKKPFEEVFRNGSELIVELEIDTQIWRGFGAVTAGASFGFVQYLGRGRAVNSVTGSYVASDDTTVLNLVPLRLTIGYHITMLSEMWAIPLVPYIQGGLSYYLWWVTNGAGDVSKWAPADEDNESVAGYGGIIGMHFGAGLKFLLDILNQEVASGLQADIGLINTYLFAEYSLSWVDGFNSDSHMDLSDQAMIFGLMIEF